MPPSYLLQHNPQEFWNLVYYFTECGLPFDLMLPYRTENEDDLTYREYIKETKAKLTIVAQI